MIEVLTVQPGTKLQLKDGSIVKVVQNPQNGIWLFCDFLSSPDADRSTLSDSPIYAEEFVALVED